MAIVNKTAPWFTFLRKMESLFGRDPEIKINMSENVKTIGTDPFAGEHLIELKVKTDKKANALSRILPPKVTFGDVVVRISVISEESAPESDIYTTFCDAFKGNPVVSKITSRKTDTLVPDSVFVEFRNEVVQFFDDRLDDPRGNFTTLNQNIAKDILGANNGVSFCTAPVENVVNKTEKTISKKSVYDLSKELDKLFGIK